MECRRRESHLGHGLMQHHLKAHGGSSYGVAETVVTFPQGHRIVMGSLRCEGPHAVSAPTLPQRPSRRAVLSCTCAKRSHLTLHLRETKPRRFFDTATWSSRRRIERRIESTKNAPSIWSGCR